MISRPPEPAGALVPRRVLVAVDDLFFVTRIRAVAARAGVTIEECAPAGLAERCSVAAPDLLILDLHGAGDPLRAVRALKANAASARIPIIGFYSHVDRETRRRALEAGVDRVLPRSAFTAKLEGLLAGSP